MRLGVFVVLGFVTALVGCAAPEPPKSVAKPVTMFRAPTFEQEGQASWYGKWHDGRRTANGETFDMDEMTAAHRTLPFGSRVLVTYNGRSVVVRINDRGPFTGGRVIDLSQAAAAELGLVRAGSGRVELALLGS